MVIGLRPDDCFYGSLGIDINLKSENSYHNYRKYIVNYILCYSIIWVAKIAGAIQYENLKITLKIEGYSSKGITIDSTDVIFKVEDGYFEGTEKKAYPIEAKPEPAFSAPPKAIETNKVAVKPANNEEMSMISKVEYEKIFKDSIIYTDLDGVEDSEFLYEYRGEHYSGIGFAQSDVTEILSSLIAYEDGIEYGIRRKWHPNGFIQEERLVQLNTDGYIRQWDEIGKLIYEAIYIKGISIYKKTTDESIDIKGIASFRKMYNSRQEYYATEIKPREIFSDKIEKNFKDSYYINGILAIFEKYKDDTRENVIDEIGSEILKFSEEQKAIRDKDYCMFHRIVNEEKVEIKDNIVFYNGDSYTGMTSKFIDDESISGIVLCKLTGYINGKKEGFELLWEPEELLNPGGVEKYGTRLNYLNEDHCWWSKGLIKEMSYYKMGKLIDHQEWDNSFAKE